MKKSNCNQCLFSVCLTLLFVSSTSHAGTYKWVDANGQTHYSERKEDADKAQAIELKINSKPAPTQASDPLMQSLLEQERRSKKRSEQQMKGNTSAPPIVTKPESLSGGRSDGTDASRCNLARDVISGAVRHNNGAPIDKHDIEVAERDIRSFCH
jgi:hypothetical protein